MRWDVLPLRSKNEAAMDSRSITMVARKIRGTEKSVDRRRLIEYLSYQLPATNKLRASATRNSDPVTKTISASRANSRAASISGVVVRFGWSEMSRIVSGASARAW